ncbi:MAG: AAA family ATPase [Akkermansiaceae bacterium]
MKILKLRFQNLNSLYGNWEIDFTSPEIQDSGLFAITGPTGGGKSTILDAICLALYGETPRLDSINANSNEIMSKHTGECHSEIEYEIGSTRYLSKWYQKRARAKADQKLQAVKREISRWNEQDQKYDPLAEKLTAVGAKVTEVTGMDFQRFTRTILLAQGNFAAFLKADDETRSKLLEQITGTDIYTQISKKVHERHRDEETKLKEISIRMEGVQLLSEDELKLHTAEQTDLNTAVKHLTNKRRDTTEKLTWLKGISDREKKHLENKTLIEHHLTIAKDFEPKQLQLEQGERAAKVHQSYHNVSEGRTNLESLKTKQQTLSQQITQQKTELATAQKLLTTAQEAHQAKETFISQQRPLWTEVRALDTQLDSLNSQVKYAQQKVTHTTKSHTQEQQTGTTLTNKKSALEAELATTQEYLENNTADEQAATSIELIQGLVTQWQRADHQQNKLTSEATNLTERITKGKLLIAQQTDEVTRATKSLADTETNLTKAQQTLTSLLDGKLTREYEKQLTHLNEKQELELRIQSLEQHRHSLTLGDQCPLCGSKDHPYIDPQNGQQRESKVSLIKTQITALNTLLSSITESEKTITAAQNTRETATIQLKSQTEKLQDYQARLTEREDQQKALTTETEASKTNLTQLETDLKTRLAKLSHITENTKLTSPLLDSITKDLTQRGSRWQEATKKADPIKSSLQQITLEISKHQERSKSLKESLQTQAKELQAQQQTLATAQQQREQKFSTKIVNEVEAQTTAELKSLTEQLTTTKTTHHTAEKILAQTEQSQKDTSQQLTDTQKKLSEATATYTLALEKQSFADEPSFLQALLDEPTLTKLRAQEESIKTEWNRLQTLATNLEQELQAEREKALTKESPEDLTTLLNDQETQLTEKNQHLGKIQQRLKTHTDNLKRQAADAEKLATQQQALKVWKQLHGLIGSLDGKKFRNYAQGLTFEWVVNLANTKLQTISDRYLLTRDTDAPLQLNVLDNYQGGQERSTKNLSGGESFIISLALALGLSQMVSDNIQMDSLFLDEGFGTLDEETLEMAMDALSALRQDGKLIGVISHVQELKERLTTQIIVTPTTGGKSTLSGAGINSSSIS